MTAMQCAETNCPHSNLDPARATTTEKKAWAEKLYKTGKWTEEGIGKKLGVAQQTVSDWLANLPDAGKLKRAKTTTNPKGNAKYFGPDWKLSQAFGAPPADPKDLAWKERHRTEYDDPEPDV